MSVVTTVILVTALGERDGWDCVQDWLAAERREVGDPDGYFYVWGRMVVLKARERELDKAIALGRAHVSGRRAHEVRNVLHPALAALNGGNKAAQADIGIGAYNGFGAIGHRRGSDCDEFIEVVRTAPWRRRGRVVLVVQPEDGVPFVDPLRGDAG